MTFTRRDFNKATLGAGALLAAGGPGPLFAQESLITKTIPSSGEEIPVVGLGTNRYGVGETDAERAPLRAALARFNELGGQVIDTAPGYRTSETVLGDLISDLGIRGDVFVATKVDKREGAEATNAQIIESQNRLQTDTFDLMQVHNLRNTDESLGVIREWKQEGLIRYVGITTSRANQYEEFEQVMNEQELDFIQINYSLEQREAADRILPLAADNGVGVIINRAFGGGRIFEKVGDQPLPDWAQEFDCSSWAQFLLKYAISHPAATVAIPGMTKAHHVDDNMGAARGRLPNAEERAMQEEFYDSL